MTPLIPDDKSRLAWLDGDRVIVGRCHLDLYDGGVLVNIDAPSRLLHITEPLAALMEIHLSPVADMVFSAGGWREVADDEFPISILSIPVVSWLSEEGVVMYGMGEVELHPEAGEVFGEGLAGVYAGIE